ncbi:MAG: hypothetical protein JJT85_00915 [Chromatiales bacterium]|nr:hypothetical protein [Chromatiales bacterium]
MTVLDKSAVGQLGESLGEADTALDLRGLSSGQALEAVVSLLESAKAQSAVSTLVVVDHAGENTGETPFLPVGRRLLEARRRGIIADLKTVYSDTATGFLIRMPAADRIPQK